MKNVCACFGYSGHQSTTHVDRAGVERCDLCGMRCMHQIDGIEPIVRKATIIALVTATAVAGTAMIVTGRRRARDIDGRRKSR